MVPGQGYLVNQSRLAQGEAASHTETMPVCVFCSYALGRPHTSQLYQHVPETRWPIVYSPRYNITFMGLEKLHPFDAGKWGKVISFLKGMESPSLDPTSASLPSPLPFPKTSFKPSYQKSQPSDCLPPILSKGSLQRRLLSMICPCLKPSLH